MRLVYKNGVEVKIGDEVEINGSQHEVTSIEMPRSAASTGRVYVKNLNEGWTQGYYPSVVDAEWIEREDR